MHIMSLITYSYENIFTNPINYIYKLSTVMSSIPHSPARMQMQPAHKLSFSFSPRPNEYEQTVAKQALIQSRKAQLLKNRGELFTEEKKQNQAKLIQINKGCSQQFVDQLCTEHRIEVEKLLLQISRLHDLVQDLERQNRHQVTRIKQQSEQIALMRISSLRQCQMQELEIVQDQLRSYKKNYISLDEQYKQFEKSACKQIEQLSRENKQYKQSIKKLIEDKNEEVYKERKRNQRQVQRIIMEKQVQINQSKQLMQKQMKKIQAKLQKKDREIHQFRDQIQSQQKRYCTFQAQMQLEKKQMNQKIQDAIGKHKNREEDIIGKIKRFYENRAQQMQIEKGQSVDLFQVQIQQLTQVINLKNSQIQRNFVYYETQKIQFKFMQNYFEQRIKDLRQSLKKERISHLQQSQLLKTKMSILHHNDIESLTRMYEKRLMDLFETQQKTEKLLQETQIVLQNSKKQDYELKKKSEYKISKLQEQIIRLKMGMGNLETDMKQKISNEKSMLLFTSKNFIKQVQLKTANNKFHEQQLRKLRKLLDVQANQLEQSEKNVEEKIKLAEDELTRLSNKILEVKAEAEESENKYKLAMKQKDEQIKRLNNLLNVRDQGPQGQEGENVDIMKLQEELNRTLDELGSYKMRCQQLQDQIKLLKSEGERLMIENQINSQDAKKHYKTISDKNMSDLKNFYDRRIKQLQLDKSELQKINSNQTEQITELIKKYKQSEKCLHELVRQSKKRGELETKIIHLGMDTNLVKNMAEIFNK